MPEKALAEPGQGARTLRQRFPPGFVWGVATSSYQIEGAAHEDGRGESIWDEFCRRPGAIRDGSNGDVGCDHYHHLEQDLDLIAGLGVGAYRFSISWPRVQPEGRGAWNERGFAFYERLIEGLRTRGIAPHITLYHWDLPLALQAGGGWNDRGTVQRFVEYAVEVARRFGARASTIATHNEPWVAAMLGHEYGIHAPGIRDRAVALQVAHHLLLSHGLALRAIRTSGCRTPLGIVLNQSPIHPASDSAEDLERARIEDGMIIRWYMDPLLRGSYPADVVAHLGADAPQVTDGDLQLINQPLDFLGVNYYTRAIAQQGERRPAPDRPVTDMGWEVFPPGLTELLVRLNADYRLPPVYITENGAAYKDVVADGRIADTERIEFLRGHITALADAIEAGVDARGYFVWSLLDNFEWAEGFAKRFGIVRVDYDTGRRTLKDSALWYRDFLHGR
jgi:beta-glucosidase